MRFMWDDNKNSSNFEKHEVWFEEAQTVWADSKSFEFYDNEHSARKATKKERELYEEGI